jgi:hypothetical protein
MGLVYYHGTLNIAATGFSDGSSGLFVQRDPDLLIPISLPRGAWSVYEEDTPPAPPDYYLVDTGLWTEGVVNSPLCQRGWVAQERTLSVRTVHFGKEQLFWERKYGKPIS